MSQWLPRPDGLTGVQWYALCALRAFLGAPRRASDVAAYVTGHMHRAVDTDETTRALDQLVARNLANTSHRPEHCVPRWWSR